MTRERTTGVESARRVLNILLMFSEDKPEITVDEVMEVSGISQTSAYRYLSLLRELGFVQLREPGTFLLTPQVQKLAAASEDTLDLERAALPTLRALSEQTSETSFMVRRSRGEAIFIASIEPDRGLALSFRAGSVSPLHRGAVAKVLLAFSPSRFQRNYLARHIDDPTERTRLAAEMEEIRRKGYAESLAEVDQGIWGGAVPVVMQDTVIASVSVAGPEFRIPPESRPAIIAQLEEGAAVIATELQRELEGTAGGGAVHYFG